MVLSGAPRFVVLGGAGAIGRIIVRDLFESNRKNEILVADYDREGARKVSKGYLTPRVSHGFGDARDPAKLASLLAAWFAVINCTRHQFHLNRMPAALTAHVYYLHLSGLFLW